MPNKFLWESKIQVGSYWYRSFSPYFLIFILRFHLANWSWFIVRLVTVTNIDINLHTQTFEFNTSYSSIYDFLDRFLYTSKFDEFPFCFICMHSARTISVLVNIKSFLIYLFFCFGSQCYSMDVDVWNISINPKEYLLQFGRYDDTPIWLFTHCAALYSIFSLSTARISRLCIINNFLLLWIQSFQISQSKIDMLRSLCTLLS